MKSRGILAFLLFACLASAQIDPGSVIPRVRVQVALANQGCDAATQVTLMSSAGPFAKAKANEQCEADFFHVPAGSYHLIVSSPAGAYTDSGLIEMNSPGSEELEVKVRRPNDLDLGRTMPASAFVSASDLGIPGRARKEVRKANELLAKQDLTHALENLQKAIGTYPASAVAYNNLGVVYARLGERERGREALQRAIALNARFALPYVNLARMNIQDGDFRSAEDALGKASALDSTEPGTLILLAYAHVMDHHFDDAVAIGRAAHGLRKPHALAHRLAANALEFEGQAAAAIAELEKFLAEEPSGAQSDSARRELARLQALSR